MWAYCVLDNDYAGFPSHTPLQNLQVTAAHEYYHATQFAYDIADDGWFLEATATWAEDEMYDDVNDNVQYLKDSPITHPGRPIDKFGGSSTTASGTSSATSPSSTRPRPGRCRGCCCKMWKNADSSKGPRKDMYSTQAIDKALKKTGRRLGRGSSPSYSAATRLSHVAFSEGVAQSYPVKPLAGQATLTRARRRPSRPSSTTSPARRTSSCRGAGT